MSSKTSPRASAASVNVLMYHSISNAPGPTSIPVDTFRGQVEALAECGYQALSLGGFMSWRSGKTEIASRSVVITFDDGFADFAESAFPILKSHGFTSSVFLPSGKMGGVEDWDEKPSRRRLMTWRQVADLSKENVEFGGHSVNHRDLTSLSESELKREVVECKERIAQEIGCAPVAFAPPFGKANARERQEIQNAFSLSVGTALNRADRACDPLDVPRIEMHYFRDLQRWRSYLEGRADWYLQTRRLLRGVRSLAVR